MALARRRLLVRRKAQRHGERGDRPDRLLIGGCCFGRVAPGLPWAVYGEGAWRRPSQIYLSLVAAAQIYFLFFNSSHVVI